MNIEMIRAAAERLEGYARRTPLLSSPFLDEIAGRRVWVKPECLQHTGSFKFRGAWSAVSALPEDARARGVIAYSSGNHAQGVALAAATHGTSSVIVMPRDAPQVIAGQGTTGLEIAAQASEVGVTEADVIVCCGGGGFSSGIALALEADAPGLRMRPAEPEDFDDVARSLRSGKIERNAALSGSLCDAIISPQPGDITFPILKRLAGPGMVVTETEALRAVAQAFNRLKLVAEPGGAVALAAALYHGDQIAGDDVIVTISGGNIDADVFQQALRLGEGTVTQGDAA